MKKKWKSIIIYEIGLISGATLLWYLFHPFFIPDELHIGFAVTLIGFCIVWLIVWLWSIDKKIDGKPLT